MSVCLRYYATRTTPVTDSEKEALLDCIAAHGDPDLEEWGESFGFFEFTNPGYKGWRELSILNGSTGIYGQPEIDHWIRLLVKCRVLVPGAEWTVSLETDPYTWDEETGTYVAPVEQEPPTIEVAFPPDIELSPAVFRTLAAERVGCTASNSNAEIAAAIERETGPEGRLLFSCTAAMPQRRYDALRCEGLLWLMTNELSFPGVRISWNIQAAPTGD